MIAVRSPGLPPSAGYPHAYASNVVKDGRIDWNLLEVLPIALVVTAATLTFLEFEGLIITSLVVIREGLLCEDLRCPGTCNRCERR
jgi:hypothetical protein